MMFYQKSVSSSLSVRYNSFHLLHQLIGRNKGKVLQKIVEGGLQLFRKSFSRKG